MALLVCAAGYAVQFAMFPSTDDQDAAIHAMFARFPNSYGWLGWRFPVREVRESLLVKT